MASEEKKHRKPKTKREPATAEEVLKIIQKPWATKYDMAIIGSVGLNRAKEDRKNIAEKIENDGYKLPAYVVPMDKVIEYYKINISYLKKVANIQKR